MQGFWVYSDEGIVYPGAAPGAAETFAPRLLF